MASFANEFLDKIKYLKTRIKEKYGKNELDEFNRCIETNDFEALWDLAQTVQYLELSECDDDDTGEQRTVRNKYRLVFEAIKDARYKYNAQYPQRI